MQKWMAVIAFFTIVVACNNETNFFEIKGTIANAAGKKVSLLWLTFGAKAPVVLAEDSVKQNGLFIVRTPKNSAQDIYILKVENGPEFYFINDVESISLKADVEYYKKYSTENSDASTRLHNFLNEYSEEYPSVKSAILISDSINNLKVTDSVKNIYTLQKQDAVNKLNNIIQTYSANNTYPALEAYLITKAMATMPANDVKKMLTSANAKYLNNQHLKVLQALMQQATPVQKQAIFINTDTAKKDSSKKIFSDTLNKRKLPSNKPTKPTANNDTTKN